MICHPEDRVSIYAQLQHMFDNSYRTVEPVYFQENLLNESKLTFQKIEELQAAGELTVKDFKYIQRLILALDLNCQIDTFNDTLTIRVMDPEAKIKGLIQHKDFREIEKFINDKFDSMGVKLESLIIDKTNKSIAIVYLNEEGKSISIREFRQF